ncbi:glycoside hydrolase family 16 protein [Hymenobacter defluvii]|uniref:Glycoside hydrolase family 16 protein n=1 Tax=Hymenobacter defluvii TaxID=2054411 RepID=A0ABS3TAM6_9BACT|nr:glycoside hydrolase family 16 protein [Hymenobacter defluvii]MBO3270699.1 glycoside hydrolase family 16 protein [Hymenobacter defluvii]
MKNHLIPTRSFHFCKAGASALLALSLLACTEEKKPDIPAPTPDPTSTTANAEAKDYTQYTELIWSDEFDGGGAVDQTKWTQETGGNGWGNNELQYYTNSTENSYVSSGNLIIETKKQAMSGRDYTSARLITKGKQSFTFGRIDVRAKLPKGQGIWPAIWMLGSDIDQNNWPACGEIDIMELRGHEPNKVLSTMHYGSNTATHQYKGSETTLASSDFANDFHIFSVVRSRDKIRSYVDGREFYSFTASDISPYAYPFNNPFFVILNVAVGGNFLGNPTPETINTTSFPQQMLVDYVRFYQYK